MSPAYILWIVIRTVGYLASYVAFCKVTGEPCPYWVVIPAVQVAVLSVDLDDIRGATGALMRSNDKSADVIGTVIDRIHRIELILGPTIVERGPPTPTE